MPAAAAAVLSTLVLGLSAAAGTASAGTPRPILQLRATAPLSIEGRGFAAGELVQIVSVAAGTQQTRAAVASKQGRLRVRFVLHVGRCADLTVRAVGSLGSRAVLRRAAACKKK
jgi:hypothetical protein